jgi:hypothetical protein
MGFKHLPKREPAPLEEMDKTRWEGHHSICQTLRDIYHMTDDAGLKLKCREAMAMTKAMHEKLKQYKQMEEELNLKEYRYMEEENVNRS